MSDNGSKWAPLIFQALRFVYELIRDAIARKKDKTKKDGE